MTKKILILPGDGIGQEVTSSAKEVLDFLILEHKLDFDITSMDVGGTAYEKHGSPLPDDVLAEAKASDAILFGAVGAPKWDDLDYLIIDLPPGTGDIQLTLAQKIPVTGAIIVTTPQDIALLDARKGLKMFEKVNVPIVGIVENMSTHICSNCGHEEHIFGQGGGLQMSKDYDVDLLGSLPLDISIREQLDNGVPTVVSGKNDKITMIYSDIAVKTSLKIAALNEDSANKFPKIVIERN